MSKLRIYQVNDTKAEELLEIARSTFIDTYAHLNSEENFQDYVSVNFTLEKISAELNHPESAFYFAMDQDEVMGYFKINTGQAQSESHDPDAMEIERIYVRKAFHGQGMGRQMIQKVIELARDKQIENLWLGVWEKNPGAIAFYEKLGFQKFGTHVFTVGDDDQTDILMGLRVSSDPSSS